MPVLGLSARARSVALRARAPTPAAPGDFLAQFGGQGQVGHGDHTQAWIAATVAFGDGIEPDAISITWGQTVEIGAAKQRLRLVR